LPRYQKTFYTCLSGLAALAVIMAFLTVALGIIARQVGWDFPGLDAYAGYWIAAALFLALPATFFHGDHIRVTVLLERLPRAASDLLEWWSLLVGAALSLYLSWYAGRLVWQSYALHDVSPAADATPLWIPQISMLLGCVGFSLSLCHALLLKWRGQPYMAQSEELNRAE
jgi:TRAP-type C4-dicarboxylate transport system permease small subunit